ncbi:MAG: prepilin-type N-terminal cleavage/methylation domain-containing protein [Fidelibacterota bacterium]
MLQKIVKREKGFTLVELMVTTIIGGIIAITSGIILISADKFFRQGKQTLDLGREHTIIAAYISKAIRESSADGITILSQYGGASSDSGSCIITVDPEGVQTYVYLQNGSVFLKKGTSEFRITDLTVQKLMFKKVVNGLISYEFEVITGNREVKGKFLCASRN